MIRSFLLTALVLTTSYAFHAQNLPFVKAHTLKVGGFNTGATGQISYDYTTNQLYSVNQEKLGFDIIDYTDIFKPNFIQTVDVSGFINNIRSIESANGFVFVAGDGSSPQLPGKLLIYTSNGVYRKQFTLGVTPDRMKFSPDNITLVIANEGIPDSSYTTDPAGSVNIINTSSGINFLTQADVKTVDFTLLDTTAYDPLIHIYNNAGQSPSQDLEPEAIAISPDNKKAYVVLQENNALAIIDLFSASLDTIFGLGYFDFGVYTLDASDVASQVNLASYPRLYGMHQPSDIEMFEDNGEYYLMTANQGAPRKYQGYDETVRVKNQPVDPSKFSNLQPLLQDTLLGRLNITSAFGDMNGDGLHDSLLFFGSRSFSILDSSGALNNSSADELALYISPFYDSIFNSSADNNASRKLRSDDMGTEPSAIAIGEVDGTRCYFIGLHQMGGIVIYFGSGSNPGWESYNLDRNFSVPANDPMAGDLGPTDLEFVPANRTTLGIAQLFVANRVSGTISVYQIGMGIGISEWEKNENQGAYPNPGEGVYYLGKKSNYRVYDQQGRLVDEFRETDRVNISGQSTGIYVIINADGSSIKVIKR